MAGVQYESGLAGDGGAGRRGLSAESGVAQEYHAVLPGETVALCGAVVQVRRPEDFRTMVGQHRRCLELVMQDDEP